MRTLAGDPLVRQAQEEGALIPGAATTPPGKHPPPARPDTFGKATNPLFKGGPIRFGSRAKPSGAWTSTGRLSPKNGRLRPVCRYIGP